MEIRDLMRPCGGILEMSGKFWFLLYEFPAETRLTVYRRLEILNRDELAGPGTREHL